MTPTPPPAPAASCVSCTSSRTPIGDLDWGGGPMFSARFREATGLSQLLEGWQEAAPHELTAAARSLLVHRMSMTSRLDHAAGEPVELVPLLHDPADGDTVADDNVDGGNDTAYERVVMLRRRSNSVPLELGFLAVRADLLPPEMLAPLRAADEPFGRILSRFLGGASKSSLAVSPDRFGLCRVEDAARVAERCGGSFAPAADAQHHGPRLDFLPARITVLSLAESAGPTHPGASVASSTNVAASGPLPIATALEVLLPGALDAAGA